MIVGVPRESYPGERRVALVPGGDSRSDESRLRGRRGSRGGPRGRLSGRANTSRRAPRSLPDRAEVFQAADIIVQVLCHGSNDVTGADDLPLLRPEQVLVGFLRPLGSIETIREVADRGVTSFSVELMPRTTRAQSMDALSSMATIAGYKAVVIAADRLPRIFPMLTTAAGTITPARVLVIGAGVAGLQAIATARRLGGRRLGVRPAAGLQGAGPEPGRPLRRAARRGQGRPGRPRLRPRAGRHRSTSASASCWARSSPRATSSSRPP